MSSIFYIYIILAILSVIELISSDKLIKTLVWFSASLCVLFTIGLGYQVGLDWVTYKDTYEGKIYTDSFEIFYNVLIAFLSRYISFWTFAIFVKVAYVFLLLKTIKTLCRLPTAAVTVFFALAYPFVNDPLRQLIASSVFFIGFLLAKGYPRFYLVLLATGFHSSAMILLLGKLKFFKKQSIKFLFYSLAFSAFIAFALKNTTILGIISLFSASSSEKLSYYSSWSSISNIFSSFARIIILGFSVYLGVKQKEKFNNLQVAVYQLAFLMFVIEVASLGMPLFAQRVRLYLLPFTLILLMNGLTQKSMQYRFLSIMGVISYAGMSLYLFLSSDFKEYYQLQMNLLIQYYQSFPAHNWEANAYLYWLTT